MKFIKKLKSIFRPVAVIHIDTLRREYASSWLLSKKLQLAGYRVLITSRLSTSVLIYFFQPDVLVITHTFTISNQLKEKFIRRGGRLYVCIVEEVVDDEVCMQIMYRPEVEVEKFSGVFVWSSWAKKWLITNTIIHETRVHSVGSIRNSVLARMRLRKSIPSSIKIGLLGQSQSINYWDRRHAFSNLATFDPEDHDNPDVRFQFEKFSIDAEVFSYIVKIMRQLISRGYKVSIRPHPNEDPDAYKFLIDQFSGMVELDTSGDFCEWLSTLTHLVGPASSAYNEAYLVGVPIISIHDMLRHKYTVREVFEPLNMFALAAYLPKNVEELVDLIEQDELLPKQSDLLDEYIDRFYSIRNHSDPVVDVVSIILDNNSNISFVNKLKRPIGHILLLGIDGSRLLQSILPMRRKTSLQIIKHYYYNSWLHRPSKFMLSMLNVDEN